MQKKTAFDLPTQRTVQGVVLIKKNSPFSSISMERFFPEKPKSTKSSTNSEEMDLSLKLSLDGSYGRSAEEKPLTRSSSIAGGITLGTVANGARGGPFVPSLDRSCSLPVEAEKALVKFGDLQTMRRVETRKRLLQEKLRRAAAAAETKKFPALSLPPPGNDQRQVLPEVVAWAAASASASAFKGPATSPAIDKIKALANPSGDSKHEGTFASDSYKMPYTGPRGLAEVGASSSVQTSAQKDKGVMVSPKTMVKEMSARPADTMLENPSKKVKLANPCSLKGDDMDVLRQMPSVTTTGDGPSGKRIEGFLYKYRRGQVCIVCVCHGSFLSPAEFVMHAGGRNVANPMRHITVCSNPSF